MQYTIHTRSQHAKRGRSGFDGPDTYVAVTIAPDTAQVPYVLNRDVLAARGIKIRYFGDGYQQHSGPRSQLGRALKAADDFVARQKHLDALWSEPRPEFY